MSSSRNRLPQCTDPSLAWPDVSLVKRIRKGAERVQPWDCADSAHPIDLSVRILDITDRDDDIVTRLPVVQVSTLIRD